MQLFIADPDTLLFVVDPQIAVFKEGTFRESSALFKPAFDDPQPCAQLID